MKITVNSNCLTMGNCCDRCFGRANKRKYLRTRYNVERDISIEFENLMDDEPHQEELAKVVLPHERSLLLGHRYEDLVRVQKTLDAEIDSQLVRQEEELRMEEEAYYEAKREAARVARLQRQKELAARNKAAVGGAAAWVADDDEWELAAGDDNFEKFLDSVNARSLEARTRALPQQVPIDVQSSGSSTHTKDDRSRTEASSIDLEWEHEAGMQPPPPKEKRRRHKNNDTENGVIAELAVWPSMLNDANDKQDAFSNEFEWDSDFESNSSQNESRTLLKREKNEELGGGDAGATGVS